MENSLDKYKENFNSFCPIQFRLRNAFHYTVQYYSDVIV